MKTVLEQLNDFIEDSKFKRTNNKWLCDELMNVYVRKGVHLISGAVSCTLDIASVEVREENQQQGLWTKFIKAAHQVNPWEATYVESVLNPFLKRSLIKHGWQSAGLDSFFISKNT